MTTPAIRVEQLGKRYQLGRALDPNRTLREALVEGVGRRMSALRRGPRDGEPPFWALRDISVDVMPGEVVGLIGGNGAGKSTLLKILSRITAPTTGRAEIRGRVGSLLEVGTGFHPDLTGRENTYLNGAVLGMRRVEIDRKFDEIVAFAEVERFIDTPVKRYSSGMYLRLAFAVAAYLEPEILLVDEVLSVGDAAFQKKCIGQMANVAHAGRTVLFVSHNLTAVEGICQRAIRLQEGRVVDDGPTSRVISGYLRSAVQARREVEWIDAATAPGNSDVRLRRVSVRPVDGDVVDPISVTTPFLVEFEYWNFDGTAHISPSLRLYNEQDVLICDVCSPIAPQWRERVSPAGLVRAVCQIPGNLLNDGLHRMEISLARNGILTVKGGATLVFNVLDSDEQREGWYGEWPGVLRPMFDWEIDIPAESPVEGAGSG